MKILSHFIAVCVGVGIGFGISFGIKSESPPVPKPEATQVSAATQPSPSPSPTVRIAKSRVAGGEGDYEAAANALREMAKDPRNALEVLEGTGRLLVKQRKWAEAKVALTECLLNYPKSPSCLIDMATTEIQVGTKLDQLKAVTACLSVSPNDLQCRNLAGITKINDGKYEDAAEIYERMILDNGNYGARFDDGMLSWQYGLALEGAGRMKEATESFSKACQSNYPDACRKYEEVRYR